MNESNHYGQTNANTKRAFEQNGIDYNKWLKPQLDDVELNVGGKQMSIKMWDRNPQEDLFMGNKTTCCTAIGGGNGGATPVYLLNTSFNVVELYDANGNVVGMSRVFMSNVDGKPSVIMDNIELNKTYIKGMKQEEIQQIRDGFFRYMNEYAEHITGDKETQVYFYSGDIHVPNSDLQHANKTADFIGDLTQERVYVNSAGCSWINPKELKDAGDINWLIVPKQR